jgi:16S rRNA (uracil1498-N3)-methyltransferase
MARFFVPVFPSGEGVVEFPASESRHAARVLRLGPDDEVEIFDGTGRAAICRVVAVSKRGLSARILRQWTEQRPRPGIHLLVALIKNDRFDWLVQKATELGAASIRPVAAARSVVKLVGKDAEKRRAKWVQVSVEAAKQCGHLVLPEIRALVSPPQAFASVPEGLRLVPSLHPGGRSLGEAFVGETEEVTFAIGPEGDWTPSEMEVAHHAGFISVDLGQHVLRSETAAAYCLSAGAFHFHQGVGGLRGNP